LVLKTPPFIFSPLGIEKKNIENEDRRELHSPPGAWSAEGTNDRDDDKYWQKIFRRLNVPVERQAYYTQPLPTSIDSEETSPAAPPKKNVMQLRLEEFFEEHCP